MMIERLIADEKGATAIEYGLIAALISVACIIAFQMLGLNLATVFTTVATALGQ
jgi:pilus assembly protein Flp/PilA